jgi:hypothetical protein
MVAANAGMQSGSRKVLRQNGATARTTLLVHDLQYSRPVMHGRATHKGGNAPV